MKKKIIKTKNQVAWDATRVPYLINKNLNKQYREIINEEKPKISNSAEICSAENLNLILIFFRNTENVKYINLKNIVTALKLLP